MVLAILQGRKTQTRRVVKFSQRGLVFMPDSEHCRKDGGPGSPFSAGEYLHVPFRSANDAEWPGTVMRLFCPYGQPGDHLWVRETWGPCEGGFCYRASEKEGVKPDGGKWHPSIYMFREASRLTLEITGVRVERLQDISDGDVKAEGIAPDPANPNLWTWPGYPSGSTNLSYAYELLWDSINGKTQPWASNPWVWVICFAQSKRMDIPS